MDEKLQKLKISSSLEMNLRRYKKKRTKSVAQNNELAIIPPLESDSTFEIGRVIPGPSTRTQNQAATEPSSRQDPHDREDTDLEDRLRTLLGDSYFS